MQTKRYLGATILAAWLIGSVANGQQANGYQPIYPAPGPIAPPGGAESTDDKLVPGIPGLSDWITYRRDCCEGAHGRYTPLYTEAYLRAGPSFPVGGQTLTKELKTGWSIAGGVRALFFDEPQTRAWVVDGHIINTDEGATARGTRFPVTVVEKGTPITFGAGGTPGALLERANRTLVGVGIGRAWYPWQPANADGRAWRLGTDFGGRWGSQRVNLERGHLVDVVGQMYAAVYTDVECPWRSMVFHTGVRFEWAYTWSDVLQRTSDSQDLTVFLSAGVRY